MNVIIGYTQIIKIPTKSKISYKSLHSGDVFTNYFKSHL